MAIDKKLIHFKTRAQLDAEILAGNILERSICWVKDTKQMYTHNEFYDCSGLTDEQVQKIDAVMLTGDGNKFLTDNGAYTEVPVITDLTTVPLGAYQTATGTTEAELTPTATDTVPVALGKIVKAILDNEDVVATALNTFNGSLGFDSHAAYQPTNSELSGMNVTQAIDHISTKTATEKSIGGIKMRVLTQDEYDALTTKESDCLYLIPTTA